MPTRCVLAGYDTRSGPDRCPYCGDAHFAFEDDGDPETLLVRCWCGATARARRDDPDLPAEVRAALDTGGE